MSQSADSNLVLYDGDCSFCAFQMRVITWLDWFNTVSLLPISSPRVALIAPMLTREALMEAIHCVARDGRIYRGARCLRLIWMRMPLTVPLALLLWLPGAIWLAEMVYRFISRHRYGLSRFFGCKEACALPPSRRRAGEEAQS